MDLEGVGALSAAGVALIGIPATLLVGRWQLKAALRAAEATSAAGIAQAESAYRAALDTVRAEASAAHAQWHRGIQREAYASFLLAVHRVREVSERFVADNEEDLPVERITAGKTAVDDALDTLKATQTIVELEGPDDVAAPAAGMANAAQSMARHLRMQALYERAWGKLSRATENPSTDLSEAACQLLETLTCLRRLHSACPTRSSEPNESLVYDAQAARGACYEAQRALPLSTLDDEDFDALLAGNSPYPPTLRPEYVDAVRQFDEAEVRFVYAAKIELHSRVTP
ncbi:hypothetical protein ACWHA1_12390 [Streptomyces decoyicus]